MKGFTAYDPTADMRDIGMNFAAVGDIALGDHPICVGFGTYSKLKSRDSFYCFEHVLKELERANVLFGNLECVLSERGLRRNNLRSVQMRGEPRHVQGLVRAGFNILNLANNHSMQHGREAFLETVRLLEDSGVHHCGVNLENCRVAKPTIVTAQGVTVAFLGYSLINRDCFPGDPLYTQGDIACIETDVRQARGLVDAVVVSLHWGDEFVERPSPQEILMGRKIIDAGADLIIGHHPHVLRGIENYNQGIIVYSLGNFIADMAWDRRLRESLIFKARITRTGIKSVNLTPVYLNDNYQPTILEGKARNDLLLKIGNLSRQLARETCSSRDEENRGYEREAARIHQIYRKKSHRYFVSRIHKCDVRISMQQFGIYVGRRVRSLAKTLVAIT